MKHMWNGQSLTSEEKMHTASSAYTHIMNNNSSLDFQQDQEIETKAPISAQRLCGVICRRIKKRMSA